MRLSGYQKIQSNNFLNVKMDTERDRCAMYRVVANKLSGELAAYGEFINLKDATNNFNYILTLDNKEKLEDAIKKTN